MSLSSSRPTDNQSEKGLPKAILPECWTDDRRMDVLFAHFRPRSVNPDNYDTKVKFWKELITKYAVHKGDATIDVKSLRLAFERNDKMPYGLKTVIDEMLANHDIETVGTFLEMPQDTWTAWAVAVLIKKPIYWGFNMVKERLIQVNTIDPDYVVIATVKKHARLIQSVIDTTNIVLSEDELEEKVKGNKIQLTSAGTRLALHYLVRIHEASVDSVRLNDNEEPILLIKIAPANQKVEKINEIDRSIYELTQTERSLTKLVEELEADIIQTEKQVRTYLNEGKKQLAKQHLRKSHVMAKKLEKQSKALENIQTILTRIHDTKENANIIDAYKLGSRTLKTALADSGITIDDVDDAIEDVKESLEQHDEILSTLSKGQINNTTSFDESELEKELNDILIDEREHNINHNIDEIIEERLKDLDIGLVEPGTRIKTRIKEANPNF